jgi:putative nucleotidyltransferase with HDIG domain
MVLYFNLTEEEESAYALIRDVATEAGQEAYIVGGYVRDKILGRRSKDIDIVVLGDAIAFARTIASKISPKLPVATFKNFGTASVRFGEIDLEFVGARKESYSADSRKPAVESGTLYDDQLRRDFTINALSISMNLSNYGELIDPFDGMEDLERRVIKTPLDADITFSDDPLRMLRAIRFANQLDFEIDPITFSAIARNKERIKIVSKERIYTELDKIMKCDKPSVGFHLLFESGLLDLILPELAILSGVEYQEGKGHKDNFVHTLQVLDNLAEKSEDVWLRWAALLHDIGKAPTKRFDQRVGWTFHGHDALGAVMVPRIFKRLRMPLDHNMKFVQKLVKYHLRPISLTKEDITDSAIRRLLFDAGEDIDALMMLCEADITSKNVKKVERLLANYELVREKLLEVEEKDRMKNWQPPIDGNIIMETFELHSGPVIGELKNEIREAVLEGVIKNEFDDAYKFLLELGKKRGLRINETLQ